LSSSSVAEIEVQNLRIQYPDRDRPAIDRLTESVAQGEIVAITGPSGCGKSTLCQAIAGFIPEIIPARVEGEILVGGSRVHETDSARIAQRIGYIQQDPDAQICTLHVEREVAFGPENLCLSPQEVTRRVDECLEAVGIEALRHRETTELSGGEKQRLAIASILAMHPRILLLDEPTANLDPHGAKMLFDLLSRLRRERGMTLVVVEHRLQPLLEMQPRILVLDRGLQVDRHARTRMDPKNMGRCNGKERSGHPIPVGDCMLSIEQLSFAYQRPLLENLSLDLRHGEILGVIGPNGGGKTTLLRLIAGLETPDTGRVQMASGANVGFVFQHPHHQIFERTVERELLIDRDAEQPTDVTQWLAAGRLDGLGGVPPLSLSLGEQRRLTLLTALRRHPDLLLLDEPFIGQDRQNVDWIVSQILDHCGRGGGVILVSHDIPLVEALAHRILYLDKPTHFGAPTDVFDALRVEGRAEFLPGFWEDDR